MSATLTYQYVYFGYLGRHQRQPRSNPAGEFISLGLPSGSATLAVGTHFSVSPVDLPATLPVGGAVYTFAFVNVTGLVEGGMSSTDINDPPGGTVGNAPVNVLVVYVPPSGSGGGDDWGATIDAFDETTGTLVNNTFIIANPDNGETNDGNVNGFVDTTANTETITAIAHIIPSGLGGTVDAHFHKWVNFNNANPAINGLAVTAQKQTSPYLLAFYNNPKKIIIKDIIKEKDFIKEVLKDHKEYILDIPRKEIGDNWPIDPGGPVESGELQRINERMTRIENQLGEVVKGLSFIKQADRPDVGKNIAKGGNKSE